jgi:hypothetical protein
MSIDKVKMQPEKNQNVLLILKLILIVTAPLATRGLLSGSADSLDTS